MSKLRLNRWAWKDREWIDVEEEMLRKIHSALMDDRKKTRKVSKMADELASKAWDRKEKVARKLWEVEEEIEERKKQGRWK